MTATKPSEAASAGTAALASRAEALQHKQLLRIWIQTDRLFAGLFVIQWLACIAVAVWLSPRTWAGGQSSPHFHVWAAIYVGGVVALFPTLLGILRPGHASTRYVISVAQMLMSSLLIQFSGGRIETHFHVFGSLAFLSFYRDWRVLVPATIVVAADQFLRGWFWPQSVFGVLAVSPWRWVEHAGWVIFENIFLTVACIRSQREMRIVAERSAELEVSAQRYRSVMEQAADGICLLDPETKEILESNRAFQRLLRDTEQKAGGHPGKGLRAALAKLSDASQPTGSTGPRDVQVRKSEGSTVDLSVTVSRISFGVREVLCASVRDVTERRKAQEELRHAALHDALTGLPNRTLFTVLLERAVSRARRRPESRFGVLFVDVDTFKIINDKLGHLGGDELLRSIASRMRAVLRDGDVVARFGGDEFTLLVDDMQESTDAVDVAIRVQNALKAPFTIGGRDIRVTASIGIAVASPLCENGDDLLRDADIAMYRAKALGKNRYEQFDPVMGVGPGTLVHHPVEIDLRRGLERGEFVLQYQPILALPSQRIVGFEALLRWHKADGVIVPPGDFISIAEETGLIVPLGAWVLKEACRQMAEWQKEARSPWLTIAVNMSPTQLQDPGFIDDVTSALEQTGLAATTLHLEITENALVESSDEILARLCQLKERSVRLYLDDFGVGYSSLGYLHRFPLDMIKIDRSFIKRMAARDKSDTVVEAIITLGKKLGMGVVAEGVETFAQLERLEAAACEQVQGYLFSPPVDAEHVVVTPVPGGGHRLTVRSRRWKQKQIIGG